jgi:hypothetical protein
VILNHSRIYKHIKTGNLYTVVREVINSTNANDGQVMIVYHNQDNQYFAREKEEFLSRFKMKKYE